MYERAYEKMRKIRGFELFIRVLYTPPPLRITFVQRGQKKTFFRLHLERKEKKKGFFWGTRHNQPFFFLLLHHPYSANICKRLPVGGSFEHQLFKNQIFLFDPHILNRPFSILPYILSFLFYKIFFSARVHTFLQGSAASRKRRRLGAEKYLYLFVFLWTRWFQTLGRGPRGGRGVVHIVNGYTTHVQSRTRMKFEKCSIILCTRRGDAVLMYFMYV